MIKATKKGMIDVVKQLLDLGANVNSMDKVSHRRLSPYEFTYTVAKNKIKIENKKNSIA